MSAFTHRLARRSPAQLVGCRNPTSLHTQRQQAGAECVVTRCRVSGNQLLVPHPRKDLETIGFQANFWFLLFSDKRNPPPERRNIPSCPAGEMRLSVRICAGRRGRRPLRKSRSSDRSATAGASPRPTRCAEVLPLGRRGRRPLRKRRSFQRSVTAGASPRPTRCAEVLPLGRRGRRPLRNRRSSALP